MNFNTRKLFSCLIICAVLAGAAFYRWSGIGPTQVVAAKTQTGIVSPTVLGIGTVQAKTSYTIGPTQTGRIAKLYVDQGDTVTVGQLLGEIDPVDLDQQVAASQAALLASQHDVNNAQARIQDAKSRMQVSQSEFTRYTQLRNVEAISQEQWETKQNEAAVAIAALDAAVAAFQSAQSKVRQAEADYQAKLAQKNNLLLISPANGIVIARQAEAGSTVTAGSAVFVIVDPNSLWVQTRIDQTRFAGIHTGQTAGIVLRSRQNDSVPGFVARLEIQGDTVTEERLVDVQFQSAPSTVLLGDSAEVTIYLPTETNCLYVPAAAVRNINKQEGVWVIQDGRVSYTPVKTGIRSTDGNVQILAGLTEEQWVVAFNKEALTEGTRVRQVKTL